MSGPIVLHRQRANSFNQEITKHVLERGAGIGSAKKQTSSTSDPTVNFDSAAGYSIFSEHINTDTPALFKCFDATEGAAIWREIPLW
jgi:hypothetical protein